MGEDRLVVLNKDDDTLSIIDAATGDHHETVPTAFNPHEVAIGPDGDRAFVTCSLGGTLLVYDTETWEREARLDHDRFDFPHGLAVRESAGELWLVATYASEAFVIDLETLEFLETFPTYQDKSHMIAFGPDERYAYFANIGSDNVTVVHCDDRAIVADPPVGEGPEGIAVHPEAGVLVSNQDDGYLSVLDLDSFEESDKALLGETPIRVVLSPDRTTALVPNRESDSVSVIDCDFVRDGKRRPWEVARIPVGIWPGGTTFDPTGETAYVANNKTNDVSVIDVADRRERERFAAGTHPDGIAYLQR